MSTPETKPAGPEGAKQFSAPQPATPPAQPAAAFPAAPDGFVNVLVDGRHVVAGAKDNLIEAAKRANVEIPYFCYHPRLSIAGQCRMCLVETSDMPGRLVAGCQIRVKEGLRIITDTPAIAENQRAVMEFHLVNHPVDCPICDQSGECKLQDYYMGFDAKPSRLHTLKVAKPKRKVFGPLVVYDAERCILCTRCVRFMNEVAEEPQLAMVGRGDHSEIDVVPGQQLDSKYSGNTVDICPVGALLNRDFRFTSRVWYLENTRTLCDGCANGCNVGADARGDVVYRYLPRRNEEVNQVWLCDDGRVSYHRTTDARLKGPRAGRGDDATYPYAEQSVELARDVLKPLVGSGALAVGISAALSTEEAYAAAVFARDVLRTKKVFATGRGAGAGDDFLIRADKNPNTNGLKLAAKTARVELGSFEALEKALGGQVTQLVLFGAELPGDEARLAAKLASLETVVVFAANDTAVAQAATLALPLATHLEFDGTFVNYYGRLQRFTRVVPAANPAQPAWAWASLLTQALGGELQVQSATEAFGLLAATGAPFAGLTLETLPATGLTLPGLLPAEFPRKAPKPAEASGP